MGEDAQASKTKNLCFEECFSYYKEAIAGRNFHYQNYNTWVNLYAIFTGALFAGFYMLYNKDNFVLSFIVCTLGFICSVCWHYSVKGYYHWMLSWIRVVHAYEKKLAEFLTDENYFVYSVYQGDLSPTFFQRNISTQKVTVFFTFDVIVSWLLVFLNTTCKCLLYYSTCYSECFQEIQKYITLAFVFLLFVLLIFSVIYVRSLRSCVHKMKKTISEGK